VTGSRPSITAAVIARDEERLIQDCLDSLAWADEVLVVVDAATRDRTGEIARASGARVAERVFDTFAAQRDAALRWASGAWVLFVDADERVSPALRQEVCARVAAPDGCVGFWIPRRNVLMGRVLRHAGWAPDYQLRLLERGHARYDPRRVVHEVPVLDGPAGYLSEPLVHFNYRDLKEFFDKQERYCGLEARRWLMTYGRRPRLRSVLGQPLREFWRRYVVLEGYREGGLGLALCLALAWYAGKAVWLARRSGRQGSELGDARDAAHAEHELGQ
jgi:glycosyltransferase involved in cell wall biosynthesis